MGHAIDLDDKLAIKRCEVDNVPIDRVLASKLPMGELAVA
jgi:hypothetical protein